MLSQDVERYATLQRALGYKFGDQSRSLKLFADYAMAHGDQCVGVERVPAWAVAQTPSAPRRCRLVAQVRRFALAMHAENSRHEVPPRDCVGHAKVVRKSPYIYTADDIDRIMGAAQQIPPKGFIAPLTLMKPTRSSVLALASALLRILTVVPVADARGPGKPAPIAVHPHEAGGVDVALLEVKRTSDNAILIRWEYRNQTKERKQLTSASTGWVDRYRLSLDSYLTDPLGNVKYPVLEDDERRPIAAPHGGPGKFIYLLPGRTLRTWAKYAVPPGDVVKLTVCIGGVEPFENVPVSK